MWRNERGFLLLGVYYLISMVMLIITVGLTRSMTELRASQQSFAIHQAFHLAEAGVDNTLIALTGSFRREQRNTLLLGPDGQPDTPDDDTPDDGTFLVGPDGVPFTDDDAEPVVLTNSLNYTVTIQDNQDEIPDDPFHDQDRHVWLTATGRSGGVPQTIRVLLDLPEGERTIFDNTITATRINMDGNAVLGDPLERVRMFLGGYGFNTADEIGQGLPLETSGGNTVWAESIDFSSAGPLHDICPNCDTNGDDAIITPDASVFPVNPPPAPQFHLGQPDTLRPVYDVKPYFRQAMAQEYGREVNGVFDMSGDGNAWHHIKQDTTLPAGTYEGIIYVEAGKWLTIGGDVTIKGTIVHEGLGWSLPPPDSPPLNISEIDYTGGGIKIDSKASLTIDSCATTPSHDVDNNGQTDPAFACGLAIMGTPILKFQNTGSMNIDGFVMAGSVNKGNVDKSAITSSGTIRGGLVGLWGISVPNEGLSSSVVTTGLPDGPDPGTAPDPITGGPHGLDPWLQRLATRFASVRIGGQAKIILYPPSQTPPGLPPPDGGGLKKKPIIKVWTS